MSSTGNTTDFGDLTQSKSQFSGGSNSTRGLFFGGFTPSQVNNIDFITIATTGNAFDFGDTTNIKSRPAVATSPTRALSMCGYGPGALNIIDFVEIATTGNAVDFGDTIQPGGGGAACSSGLGGL